jgi:hypothetical protein
LIIWGDSKPFFKGLIKRFIEKHMNLGYANSENPSVLLIFHNKR